MIQPIRLVGFKSSKSNYQPLDNENNYRNSVNKQPYRSTDKVGFIKNIMNKIKNKRHL